MPKAITTKFHGWTPSKPSRVSASDGDGRVYVTAQDANSSDNAFGGAHDRAALALCRKRGWTGQLVRGGIGDGGYAYVFADGDTLDIPGTVDPLTPGGSHCPVCGGRSFEVDAKFGGTLEVTFDADDPGSYNVDDSEPGDSEFDGEAHCRSCDWAGDLADLTDGGTAKCRKCGETYPEGGDGYDGMCPSCADKAEKRRKK